MVTRPHELRRPERDGEPSRQGPALDAAANGEPQAARRFEHGVSETTLPPQLSILLNEEIARAADLIQKAFPALRVSRPIVEHVARSILRRGAAFEREVARVDQANVKW